MDYSFYSDAELRNLLFVEPGNPAAVAEAVRRFCHPKISDEDLQKVQDILDEMESEVEACDPDIQAYIPSATVGEWCAELKAALHVD